MKKIYGQVSLFAFLFLLMILGCKSETGVDVSEMHDYQYVDILNYKGIPDSTDDRSVFAFFDQGAWHGYALPLNTKTEYLGSFIGPFLLTQDNGAWISPCLSKLELIDLENNQPIKLEDAKIEEITSYPGKLKQVFQTKSPKLNVILELIFVSSRTVLTRVKIENIEKNNNLNIGLRWSGNSFLEGVHFSKNEKSIQIGFSKNDNIGLISTDNTEGVQYLSNGESYEIFVPGNTLKSGESLKTHLSQTFCFSEKERQIEEGKLTSIFKNPEKYFSENRTSWNLQLTRLHASLNDNFKDKSSQNLAVKCLLTLNDNWRSPAGFLKHDGFFPSYNYEWFNGFWSWDSWKHAAALAPLYPELAKNQIRVMYDFQDETGMIADCVYRDTVIENHNWRDTKPPLSAWAIWKVVKSSDDRLFAEEMLPKVEKYHEWWYKYRDHDQNGLCEYGSTDGSLIAAKWESGMDNAVRFDNTKIVKNKNGGSMNCESVDLNAYLFAEKNYLAEIANYLGESEKADRYKAAAEALKKQIQTLFYDDETGWFYDIDLDTKKHLKILGPEGWIPLWANAATPQQAELVRKTMLDSTKFATYIPFPTLAADHPKFTPKNGYWRGPIWLDQVYFAISGLKKYGYKEEAFQFTNQVFDRLEGLKDSPEPIRENYHPLTGEGMESHHFSWSAAHLLMLLSEE